MRFLKKRCVLIVSLLLVVCEVRWITSARGASASAVVDDLSADSDEINAAIEAAAEEAIRAAKQERQTSESSRGSRNSNATFDTSGGAHRNRRGQERSEAEDATISEDFEKKIKEKQAEARRQKAIKERQRAGMDAVRRTIQAAASDDCDWRSNPLAVIKGELCGSHYKVLGLSRTASIDKSTIKKAYRATSLLLHPDKNPSDDALTAFKILQNAYECLIDDECKESYDLQLAKSEQRISWRRNELRQRVLEQLFIALDHTYYHLSVAANYIYQTGMNVWDWAGDWTVVMFDEELPLGRAVLFLALLWRGTLFLKLFGAASAVVRLNYEIAKSRGML